MEYTCNQAAAKLGISGARVRQLAIARKIGRKHGAAWLFTDDDLEKMAIRVPGRPWPKKASKPRKKGG